MIDYRIYLPETLENFYYIYEMDEDVVASSFCKAVPLLLDLSEFQTIRFKRIPNILHNTPLSIYTAFFQPLC